MVWVKGTHYSTTMNNDWEKKKVFPQLPTGLSTRFKGDLYAQHEMANTKWTQWCFCKMFSHIALLRKFWSCLSFSSMSWFLIFESFSFFLACLFVCVCVFLVYFLHFWFVWFSFCYCWCSLKRVGDRKRHVFRHLGMT